MEVVKFLHLKIKREKLYKAFGIVAIIVLLSMVILTKYSNNNLDLEIIAPKSNNSVYYSPIPVTGTVSIPSAKVTINGTPVVVAENGYFQGSADLVKGENTIRVVAEIEGKGRVSKDITVTYSPKR